MMLVSVKWYLMVFTCASSMANNVEHLFVCVLSIYASSLGKYVSDPLPIFYISCLIELCNYFYIRYKCFIRCDFLILWVLFSRS